MDPLSMLGMTLFYGLSTYISYRNEREQRNIEKDMLRGQYSNTIEEIYGKRRSFSTERLMLSRERDYLNYETTGRGLTTKTRQAVAPKSLLYNPYHISGDIYEARKLIDEGYSLTKRSRSMAYREELFGLEADQQRELADIQRTIDEARYRQNYYIKALEQ